ncbi:UDP-N-acetylglucosamine transporter TMEM241 isoform X6 [Ascaphus truei]|uniref:UDP-N-acetylglucosamine transporter TMEM241 isoform X6 n=1 Tax=Ascaphus truei TaxID=8439 RepID=UPI003F597D09
MYFRGPAVGLTYCCFYLASYFTNKSRCAVMAPGLSSVCGNYLCRFQGFVKTAHTCVPHLAQCGPSCELWNPETYPQRAILLHKNIQFDADGYFWGVIHLVCVGCYKVFQKSQKSSLLSDLDQQYINYVFRGSPQCLGVSISLFLQVSQWVLCQWDFGILAGAYFSEVKGQPLLSTSCVLEFLCQGYYSWFVTGFLRYYNECTTDFMLPDWCPRRSTACLYRAGRSIKTNLEDMKSPLFHHRTQNVGLSELYIAPTHTHRTDAENVGPERRLTVYPFEGKLLLLPGKHYQDAWLPLRG